MDRLKVVWITLIVAPLVFDRAPDTSVATPTESAPTNLVLGSEARTLGQEAVAAHLDALNPTLSDRQVERISRAVLKYSAKYELDPALVLGVITQESAARLWVRSPKGAIGLMQVMPYMMGTLPVAGNLTTIESNIEAGCIILSDNIRRLGEQKGILAYFWGNEIRGIRYWQRVEQARASIRRQAES